MADYKEKIKTLPERRRHFWRSHARISLLIGKRSAGSFRRWCKNHWYRCFCDKPLSEREIKKELNIYWSYKLGINPDVLEFSFGLIDLLKEGK